LLRVLRQLRTICKDQFAPNANGEGAKIVARSRVIPSESVRIAQPMSAANARPKSRSTPRRLAFFAVAVYCLLAWVVVFRLIGVGVDMLTSPKLVHYAERGTDQ
jgi:hypothetical protein